MANLKAGDRALIVARDAHRERTEHTDVTVFGNFVECAECGAHAHILGTGIRGELVLHNQDFSQMRFIWPAVF